MKFVYVLPIIAIISLLSLAMPTFAQQVPAQIQPQSPLRIDCGTISPTKEELLDRYRAVALHGDLTDVSFIEKTLNVKFDVQTRYQDGHPIDTTYGGGIIGNSAIHVYLTVIDAPILGAEDGVRQNANWKAKLDFIKFTDGPKAACSNLTVADFAKSFDSQFPDRPPGPHTSMWYARNSSAQFLPDSKTGSAHIIVGYEGDMELPYIEQVNYTADSDEGKKKLLPPTPPPPDLQKNRSDRCASNTLTGEQFGQMLGAVALHGDLKDIPFLEQIFHTNFVYTYEIFEGIENRDRAIYISSSSVPFRITLITYEDDISYNNGRLAQSAILNIDEPCFNFQNTASLYMDIQEAQKKFPQTVIVQKENSNVMIFNQAVTEIDYRYRHDMTKPVDWSRFHLDGISISQLSRAADIDKLGTEKAISERKTTDVDGSLSACTALVKKDTNGDPIRKYVHYCMGAMGYSVIYDTSLPVICDAKLKRTPDGSVDNKQDQEEWRNCLKQGMPILPNSSPIKERYGGNSLAISSNPEYFGLVPGH